MAVARIVKLVEPFNEGLPGPEHFRIEEEEVPPITENGSIQVTLKGISADPYLRFMMKDVSSFGNFGRNGVITGFVVGVVTASENNANWCVGDLFGARLPFATVQNLRPADLENTIMWKLTDLLEPTELTLGLGILGMPGSTAYGGLVDILKPQPGEVIFVSSACGAVGSLVGMLAKNVYNCTTIASCGGPQKCTMAKERFHYDCAIDYKTVASKDELKSALKDTAPNGIDMYFECVGGIHFEAALESLRTHGRIAVCGSISHYNNLIRDLVSVEVMSFVEKQAYIEGFLCDPWLTGKRGTFLATMHRYWREGKVVPQETVYHGLESFGEAMRALFTGANVGKVVIRLD